MGDNSAPEDQADAESRDRPSGRVTRFYSPVERAGLMWLCVKDGVSATAKAHDVPRSTLNTWLEETGGIGAVQEWLTAEALRSFLRFEQSLYAWAIKQVEGDHVSNEQAWVTVRKLIDARAGALAAQGQNGEPAVAKAAAMVTLKVIEKDGEVKVIDLGPPPEDESDQEARP